MFGTYNESDVIILLKDISNLVEPKPDLIREKLIQSGVHYSSMLPIEYKPSPEYLATYFDAVKNYAVKTAENVQNVSEKIWKIKDGNLVLVSLARAGTPIGILIKHYLDKKYHTNILHYTISIIRDIGIDLNAISYILSKHNSNQIIFVDGWTGKGTIRHQLDISMQELRINPSLAVLSDPAHISDFTGTYEDFLIPSSCLNSTISGLLSRTFYREDIIGPKDFHGSIFYKNLIKDDLTYHFINSVEKNFDFNYKNCENELFESITPKDEIANIAKNFNIEDLKLIKPSIGEATRVLLRRLPWKILVNSLEDYKNLGHIYTLAQEKKVEVQKYPLINYKACGLIKKI